MNKLKLDIQRFASEDGTVTIKMEMDTKTFDAQIEETERQLVELEKEYEMISKEKPYKGQKQALKEIRLEAEKLNNKLTDLRKKQEQVNNPNAFEGMGKGIKKVTKKIGKMVLAVFGIRSAFMFVRNAINTIAEGDAQLKADIDYMKSIIAYTIEPIVRGIVDLAKKLMTYIAYISEAWGKNIFKNADKSLKNANKQAKELKKTLASFDEMNILQDNSSKNDTTSPSFNLSSTDKTQVPYWIDWIARNKDLILGFGKGLALYFGASAVTKILGNIGKIFGTAGGKGLIGLLGTLKNIALVGGSIYIIGKINQKFREDVKKLHDFVIEMNEAGKEFLHNWGQKQNNPADIISTVNAHLETGKEALHQSQRILNKILGISDDYLTNAQTTVETNEDLIKRLYDIYEANGKNYDEGINILKVIEEQLAYNQLIKSELDQQGISTEGVENSTKNLKTLYSEIYSSVTSTKEGLEKMEELEFSDKKFTINTDINLDTSDAEKEYSNLFTKLGNSLATVVNPTNWGSGFFSKLKNIWGFAKGGIVIPKLASGGIINMPSRGVPLANAIGGERGAEGVIPLTDSQQMELLGEAIGKYITINANIVNTMNGRVISKELQKVQNDSNFAFNR